MTPAVMAPGPYLVTGLRAAITVIVPDIALPTALGYVIQGASTHKLGLRTFRTSPCGEGFLGRHSARTSAERGTMTGRI